MGTLQLWEPVLLELLRSKGLGAEQVPITLLRREVSEQGKKLVMHALEGSLAEAGRLPGCQNVELVGRVDAQVHFGRLQGGMAQPETDLPDIAGRLQRVQSASVPLISCKR